MNDEDFPDQDFPFEAYRWVGGQTDRHRELISVSG